MMARSMNYYVIFLASTATNLRTWNALHRPWKSTIISQVLSAESLGKRECKFCSKQLAKRLNL
ncbi:hypothetical protein LINGRAHAP2_LOCUS13735, partial [Linum grandiflorum]